MRRIFFHNVYDADSRAQADSLSLQDVDIYDYFNTDKRLMPDIPITRLPYLIDKYIGFAAGQYLVGEPFLLEFYCRDYLDNLLADEEQVFRVVIDGDVYDEVPEGGIIRAQLTWPEAGIIPITITGYGYLPFSVEIEVVDL